MAVYLPPMQRKKKVWDRYNPDTFRVISEHAASDHPKYKPVPYTASFEPSTPVLQVPICDADKDNQNERTLILPLKNTKVIPQFLPDYRAHNPHPTSCGFLDKNVRFLNAPICNVFTKPVQHEEKQWWPARTNAGTLQIPPYTRDTHYRNDFNYLHGENPQLIGRHTANPNKEPALGSVPVNFLREKDGSQRFHKESISYEHLYNCRNDPNYPWRGKRHGAFVWKRTDPISQKKFIEYYTRLAEEERKVEEAGLDAADISENSPVIRSSNYKDFSPKYKRTYMYRRKGSNVIKWEDMNANNNTLQETMLKEVNKADKTSRKPENFNPESNNTEAMENTCPDTNEILIDAST